MFHIFETLSLIFFYGALGFGLVIIFFACIFHVFGLGYSVYKFHRKPTSSKNVKELPGVSIIKPLMRLDPNLEQNLETFFHLNYPRYEILFCVQEYDENLVRMIERLCLKHSNVSTRIFIGSAPGQVNGGITMNIIDTNDQVEGDEKDEDRMPLIANNKTRTASTITKTSRPLWKRILLCGSKPSSSAETTNSKEQKEIKNPKIANMLPAYENAQYKLILISDSGVMMLEDALYDMVSLMTDKVGLVHQMPFTCDKSGFAGSLEKVYFGTQHARMYMTINFVGINCVTGMSCLIRKECLDVAGGLKAFGDYIAEDFYMAYEVAKQGWKLRVASSPCLQNAGEYSLEIWIARMIRWSKLRMKLSPLAYLEPLQECFSSAIFAGFVTNYLFDWNALVVSACHILVWFLLDYTILRIIQGGSLPFVKSEFAIAWLIRELSSYYIYIKALTGSSVVIWRGKAYRLRWGTRAEEIVKPTLSSISVPTVHVEPPPTIPSSPLTDSDLISV